MTPTLAGIIAIVVMVATIVPKRKRETPQQILDRCTRKKDPDAPT